MDSDDAWFLALTLLSGGISGWADCWPYCDAWDGVAYWLLVGPPLACVVAVIAAAVVAAIDRRK